MSTLSALAYRTGGSGGATVSAGRSASTARR